MKYTFSILLAAAAVYALPANDIGKRAIDASTLNNLNFYEQYAAAAYCQGNNIPGSSTKITCPAGNCPQVQYNDVNSIAEFQNQGRADATGFVAVDKTRMRIVIAYRGSKSVLNWLGNFDYTLLSVPQICPDCKVHSGFWSSWQATQSLIQNAVARALQQNPGYSIVVTGHSLGGAVATLAAADLRRQGRSVTLYTYGSPMVGNVAFARYVSTTGPTYRITHLADAVPKLPGYWPLGYAHTYPEYWIGSANSAPVTTNDVYIVNVGNSQGLQGNQAFYPFADISNHLWYFNAISACSPPGFELARRDLDENAAAAEEEVIVKRDGGEDVGILRRDPYADADAGTSLFKKRLEQTAGCSSC